MEVFDELLEGQVSSLYLLSCIVNLRAFNVTSPKKCRERFLSLTFDEHLRELEMF